MAILDPSVSHAVTPVAFNERRLHRERLVDAIHSEIERKLIVIAAPAGYGKTILLSDFSAHTEIPVCWIRLSEPAQDYLRFAELIVTSLTKRFRRLKPTLTMERIRNASPEEAGSVIAAAVSESVDEAFVVLIDDVHLVQSYEESLEFLDRLILASPDQVTFILSGRQVVDISLARVMAEGNLAGFGPSQLALSLEELLELSRMWGGILATPREAEELLTTTQGWIAGILLSSTFARHRLKVPILENHALVYDYLASATLNRIRSDQREFLLESAMIPVMSASICDRILGRQDSNSMLEEVAALGLFVTWTEDDPRTFEYHPIFREFLMETLQASNSDRFMELAHHTAQDLAEQGDFEGSVRLHLRAGRLEDAVRIIEESSQIARARGWLSTLENWENALEKLNISLPVLGLDIAECLIARGSLDLARERLEKLELPPDLLLQLDRLRSLVYIHLTTGELEAAEATFALLKEQTSKVREDLLRRKYTAICNRFEALLTMRTSTDWESALELSSRAVENFASIPGEDTNLAAALHTRSTILSGMGRFREALSAEDRARETQVNRVSPIQLSTTLNNLAFLYHQIGDFDLALQTYRDALTEAKRGGSERLEAFVVLGQADLFNDLGLLRQAGELYERGLELSARLRIQDLIVHSCLMTSVLHRRRTSVSIAIAWIQRALELGGGYADSSVRLRLERNALESSGNWEAGSSALRLRTMEGESDTENPTAEKLLAGYLLAQGLFRRGDKDSAVQVFEKVLRQISRGETYQDVASELLADPEFLRFLEKRTGNQPAFGMLRSRILQMKAIADRFSSPGEDQVVTAKGLQLSALGQLKIKKAEREVSRDLKPQAKEVLMFLADQGHTDKEELAEVFWSEHKRGRQTANLHMAIYSLRGVLGKETITLDGISYSISEEAKLAYDVAEFERASYVAARLPVGDPRRMFALSEAIRLYTGSFLVEYDSDWVLDRRRTLELKYLDLISALAEEKLMRNEPREAIETLRHALDVEPLRDDINAHYLEALGQLDQRSEVVRHYRRYAELLSSELGLEPSEQVRDIYQRLVQ